MTGADIVRMRLAAITAVTAIVGARIYGLELPQAPTFPAILVSSVARVPETLHLRGTTGVIVDRVQVDCYIANSNADPLGAARALSDAAYGGFLAGAATGLVGWRGSIGSPETTVDLIEPAFGPVELYVPEEKRQTIVTRDYYVHFRL